MREDFHRILSRLTVVYGETQMLVANDSSRVLRRGPLCIDPIGVLAHRSRIPFSLLHVKLCHACFPLLGLLFSNTICLKVLNAFYNNSVKYRTLYWLSYIRNRNSLKVTD